MKTKSTYECTACGTNIQGRRGDYRYVESGLSNVVLQGLEQADCGACGNSDVVIPRMGQIQKAIAQALTSSPARLTGAQLRFLRKHLGLSGEELSRYLHTDKTKISKWETGEDRIGPSIDRLVRLLAAALDPELRPKVGAIAQHLREISDDSGSSWELYVDVGTLHTTFVPAPKAA